MPRSKTQFIGWFAVVGILLSILVSSLPVPNVQADIIDNITVPKDGYVTVEFVSSDALYIDDVYLIRTDPSPSKQLLFNTQLTRVGTVAPKGGMGGEWGHFAKAGEVLQFQLFARTSDPTVTYTWYSDSRLNIDKERHVHKTSIDDYTWKMEWEDMPIPPGGDFNDAVMIVRVGGDSDGDGLWDIWEKNGVDFDYDGIIDLPINETDKTPGGRADPNHKDIFLEIDWMDCYRADGTLDHSHYPKDAAIAMIKEAFAKAPVDAGGIDNPDGTLGINLHIDISNKIPQQEHLNIRASGGSLPPGVGDFDAVKATNFDRARRSVYHYCLFVHDRGTAEKEVGVGEYGGNDLLVSLGGWNAGGTGPNDLDHDGIDDRNVGTVKEQACVLMHELGHNLYLHHGGGDPINEKPNYLSVMNYLFSLEGIPPTGRLDYSREKLPTLDESSLDEWLGIQDGTDETEFSDPYMTMRGGPLSSYQIKGTGPIDWNWDGKFDGTHAIPPALPTDNVTANINAYDDSTAPRIGTLKGFNDWENVRLFFADTGDFEDGVHETLHPTPEPSYEDVLESLRFDLKLTKSVDLTEAIPGDTLTYTVTAENIGNGPATKVTLNDTFPDGTTETRSLPNIDAGDSTTETFTFTVPFPIADLTVLTNTARITGESALGQPEEDTSNNAATAVTVIHTPILGLSKTASQSVNAGEAITYTITYENTGSGNAVGVVVTDTLPTDVYYSLALDQGAGTAPDSVTANPDGTTTLTWLVGNVLSSSGAYTIEYTARPTLLLSAGKTVWNDATLDFTDANGNDYPELSASASTDIASVPPRQDPKSLGFVRNHDEFWTGEILARIQATDSCFDGADGTLPDGQLSASEVEAVLVPGGNQAKVLMMQLLTTYYNLATRQINADTLIESSTAKQLALTNVRGAVEYAMNTLKLPVNKFTRVQYSNITRVLDEINNKLSEKY